MAPQKLKPIPHGRTYTDVRIQDGSSCEGSRKNLSGYGAFSKPKKWFKSLPSNVKNKVKKAGFGTFIEILDKSGSGLGHIEALAERWSDTTHTFHLPFGEMSLTPYDFSMITGIRVGGNEIPFDHKYWTRKEDVTRLLGAYPPQFRTGGARCSWLLETFQSWPCKTSVEEDQLTRAFLLYLFGCTIFSNLESTVQLSYLPALEHVDRIQEYNWGGAAIADLYTHMNTISRMVNRCIGGYWYAWEVWFCEYFPTLASQMRPSGHSYPHIQCWIKGNKRKTYDISLHRQEIDKLREQDVQWKPWAATINEAPQYIEEVQELSLEKIIFEGLNVRVSYQGESLLRQVRRLRRSRVPVPPHASMRSLDEIDPDELALGLSGNSAQQFFGDLNADCSPVNKEYLMPSLSRAQPITTLPLVTQPSSSQQKTQAIARTGATDAPSFSIPSLLSWDVMLPTDNGELAPYAIPRPNYAEGVPLPPHVQEVSRENMHELFFLATGLKNLCYKFKTEARDLNIKMSACLNERDQREAKLEARICELEADNSKLGAQVQELKTRAEIISSPPPQTQKTTAQRLKRCQGGNTTKRKKKKALEAVNNDTSTSSEGSYRVEFR